MLLTKQEEDVMLTLMKRALESPYGSEEQVECETMFYEIGELHGLDLDIAENYCLKATNLECMAHCLDLLHVECDMDKFMLWAVLGDEALREQEEHHGLS